MLMLKITEQVSIKFGIVSTKSDKMKFILVT
jgi:hypothetical protein